jgi:hypothetical protein
VFHDPCGADALLDDEVGVESEIRPLGTVALESESHVLFEGPEFRSKDEIDVDVREDRG